VLTDERLLELAKRSGLLACLSDAAYDRCMSGDLEVLRCFIRVLQSDARVPITPKDPWRDDTADQPSIGSG